MRLREDSWRDAGKKRAILLGAIPDPRADDHKNWDPEYIRFLNDGEMEAAQPGDVWVMRGDPSSNWRSWGGSHQDWPIIGYVLVCPNERCEEGVHAWTHASACNADQGKPCKNGGPSCWTWVGSVEDGTLTASPSLFCDFEGCGWHGWLKNGAMTGTVEPKYQRAG